MQQVDSQYNIRLNEIKTLIFFKFRKFFLDFGVYKNVQLQIQNHLRKYSFNLGQIFTYRVLDNILSVIF